MLELFKILGKIAVDNTAANDNIDETTEKAKTSENKMSKSFKNIGSAVKNALKRDEVKAFGKSLNDLTKTVDDQQDELTQLKARYQDLYLSLGKDSDEAKECAKQIEKLSTELNENKSKLNEAKNAADKLDKSLDDVGNSANSTAKGGFTTFKNMIGNLAAMGIGALINGLSQAIQKIAEFGKECIEAAAEVKAMNSQFSQVFGDLEDEAAESLSKIASDVGMLENRMKGSYTQIAAFAKTTGLDTKDALALTERAIIAAADSAAFYDRTLEETTDTLQSFLKGNYENDAALGLSCTETTRNAAANKLYGKSFQELSESQKQLTLLQMVEDANELSGAMGQAARESDTWTNQIGNLKQGFKDFKAEIGEHLLPTASKVVGKISEIVQWLTERVDPVAERIKEQIGVLSDNFNKYVTPSIERLKEAFKRLKEAFQPVAEALKPLIDLIKENTEAADLANGRMFALATVIESLAAVFNALAFVVKFVVGVIQLIVDVCKSVREAFSQTKEKLSEMSDAFDEKFGLMQTIVSVGMDFIKSKIVDGIQNARDKVSENLSMIRDRFGSRLDEAREKVRVAIDKIKKLFDFNWSLPKLKLPHVNISGKFKLSPPSVPKFSIDWYDKAMEDGMILDKPTIFGFNPKTNQFLGAGESPKGSETVVGTNSLMGMIQNAVGAKNDAIVAKLDALIDLLRSFFPELIDALSFEIVLDGDTLVARLVPKFDRELGKIYNRKKGGNW